MYDNGMNAAENREFADRIIELRDARAAERQARAAERKARRQTPWAAVSEFLLSIPPGVAVRLGG